MNSLNSLPSQLASARRRGFLSLPLLALAPMLSVVQAADAQELALATAINRSGRLRALSQRFAKAHIQVALGVLPDKGREIEVTARTLIQGYLNDLRASEQKSGQRGTAGLLERVEADARQLLTVGAQTPSRKSALEVSESADTLLASADKLTSAYVAASPAGSAKLINVAGRQRLLSQRVSKLYFLWNIGYTGDAVRKEIQATRADFNAGLATLLKAPVSTPSIKAYLELGRTQWIFLEDALTKPADPAILRNVATSSERVLEVMNDLANEYEAVLREIV